MMKKMKVIVFLTIILSLFTDTIYAQFGTPGKDDQHNIHYDISIGGPTANLGVNFKMKSPIKENGKAGTFSIIPEGGTPPYKIFIKKGNTIVQQIENITTTTEIISNSLSFGKYKVEIRDKNYVDASTNCNTITSSELELINPPLLTIRGNISQVIQCNGSQGKIKAYIQGGSGSENYTVQLLKGNTIERTQPLLYSEKIERSIEFEKVDPGSYTIKVIDKYNIEKQTSVINLINPFVFKVTSVKVTKQVNCYGSNTGEITVVTTGGTKNFNVKVKEKGNGRIIVKESNNNKIIVKDLMSGDYSVEVRDAFGCNEINIPTFSKTITQPNELTIKSPPITKLTTAIGKEDGEVEFEVSGGTLDYNYVFKGETFSKKNSAGKISKNSVN